MTTKSRMTVTVDPDLVRAGNEAVAAGAAPSLSAWVSLALQDRVDRDRRHRAMAAAIAAYEAEFGEITAAELDAQRRADRRSALVVRAPSRRPRRKT
jgi:hypothetical protein